MEKRHVVGRSALTAGDSAGAALVSEDAPPASASAATTPAGTPAGAARVTGLAVVAVAALGLFLRIWIIGRGPLNSDQAVVGLMAHEILRGHLFAFYWGQHYGGGEPYIVAALFALFGQSSFVLRLAPLLLDIIAALFVWRLGRRLFDGRVAVLAALLFWIWPEVYLYLSTVEYGFRYLALVCGLAALLFALRLTGRRPSRPIDWAALGLLLGLGWWCTPEIVYYAIPALLWLIYRLVRSRVWPPLAGVVLFVAMAALGALPWLIANVGHGFPSLQPTTQPHASTFIGRLSVFFGHVLPLVFGLRLRGSGAWLVNPVLGMALYGLLGGSLLIWIAWLALRRQAAPLVIFVLLFPLAYAYSPFAWFWKDGRYAVYLAPVLALLVASLLGTLGRRGSPRARLAPALGLIAALALTLTAAARLAPYVPLAGTQGARSQWTSWQADPNGWLRPLVTDLERRHVRDAYAGYWIAYALTFESHGRVVSADPSDDRYPLYLAEIRRSPRQAWVFPRQSTLAVLNAAAGVHSWLPNGCLTLAEFADDLNSNGVAYQIVEAGYFTIVYPARAVAVP
jgi:4-amino-4-deoxy-L-arabinose transferase-like glycosyltransferase